MDKGTKVHVNLKKADAAKLGINTATDIDTIGIIEGKYTNGVAGHFVSVDGRIMGIPDRLNALIEIKVSQVAA